MAGPGSQCTLSYDCSDGVPVVGDTVRTDAGSCYLIDRVRRSPSRAHRFYLQVTRLERDAGAGRRGGGVAAGVVPARERVVSGRGAARRAGNIVGDHDQGDADEGVAVLRRER